MSTPRNLPRQGKGRPIMAADINRERRVVEGHARSVIGGADRQFSIADQSLSLGHRLGIYKAIVAEGGTTGWNGTTMGTGEVILQTRAGDGSLAAGATVPAWSFVALDEDDICYVAEIDGGYEIISAIC